MQRIDTASGRFEAYDPLNGVQGTIVTADWLNDMQEEIVSVLTAAGIDLDAAHVDQLLTAIKAIAITTASGGEARSLVAFIGGVAVALAAGAGRMRVASEDTLNLIFDGLAIQARNKLVASVLELNPLGGDVTVNGQSVWHKGNLDPTTFQAIATSWNQGNLCVARFSGSGTVTAAKGVASVTQLSTGKFRVTTTKTFSGLVALPTAYKSGTDGFGNAWMCTGSPFGYGTNYVDVQIAYMNTPGSAEYQGATLVNPDEAQIIILGF